MTPVDFEAAQRLILKAKQLRLRANSSNMSAAKSLLAKAREINSDEQEARKLLASRFNIFETLNVFDTELVHSNFLAFLLDPRATHDQGTFFLSSFFERFLSSLSLPMPNVEETFVHTEHTTEFGRLDIAVFLHTQAAICIENKLYDIEQPEQIRRYQAYLSSLRQAKHRCVVFLSPSGVAPTTADPNSFVPVVSISYTQIASWLDEVSYALPALLASTLQMYARSCAKLRAPQQELK